jgi:hypothetical protein
LPANWRNSVAPGGRPGGTDTTSYAAWKIANGIANDAIDTDNDGMLPLAEYGSGGSPTASDAARIPSTSIATLPGPPAPNYVLFSFHWRRGADDLTPIIQESTDLAAWTTAPAEISSTIAQPDGTDLVTMKTVPFTLGGAPIFLRLRWELAP